MCRRPGPLPGRRFAGIDSAGSAGSLCGQDRRAGCCPGHRRVGRRDAGRRSGRHRWGGRVLRQFGVRIWFAVGCTILRCDTQARTDGPVRRGHHAGGRPPLRPGPGPRCRRPGECDGARPAAGGTRRRPSARRGVTAPGRRGRTGGHRLPRTGQSGAGGAADHTPGDTGRRPGSGLRVLRFGHRFPGRRTDDVVDAGLYPP